MKGIVYTLFNDLVEERFGLDVWDQLLARCAPDSGGVYTAAASYHDRELFDMVAALSEISGAPANDLVRTFGEYSMLAFGRQFPTLFEDHDAKSLLHSVHDVIHVEVKKLFPGATPPMFEYEDPATDRLVMLYRSPRKLCAFAEGLINGTAAHYDIDIRHQQSQCMLHGDDHCRFELHFAAA
jgi:hypothetical protein